VRRRNHSPQRIITRSWTNWCCDTFARCVSGDVHYRLRHFAPVSVKLRIGTRFTACVCTKCVGDTDNTLLLLRMLHSFFLYVSQCMSVCLPVRAKLNKHLVRLRWLEITYSRPLFSASDTTRKVGQTDLVLVYDHGSVVGRWKMTSLCVQRLRFVPPWLTSAHTDNILSSLYEKLSELN